jgi:hypothetical protein
MPHTIQSPPAYKRLHHHPLASAFLAILAATLLLAGVQGYTTWKGDTVLAGDGAEVSEELPTESGLLDAH